MSGLMEFAEQFFHDDDEAINKVLNIELPKFKKMEGMFGQVAANKAIINVNFNVGKTLKYGNCGIWHFWIFWVVA
jgi:hypothetical protein